jgi:hypothetical protein
MWMKRRPPIQLVGDRSDARATTKPRPFAVPAEYRLLHKYLDERFANIVVLTFAEIEDLLGFTLPAVARLQAGWWADEDEDNTPSPQARSWTETSRSARPNLLAQTVAFERAAG